MSLESSGSIRSLASVAGLAALAFTTACASSSSNAPPSSAPPAPETMAERYGTIWNLELRSATPPPPDFVGVTNSDLAFKDNYAIQGNYNGFIVWDISNPASPVLVKEYLCPASQSDVSVYQNLLFVSGEGLGGRLDCGTEGVREAVSADRLRGIRIFDITDIRNPVYIANVQTCRGSHTHSVLVDPDDEENVYVYVSGSAPVRPEEELPGCSGLSPDEDPNSALFRIEVIQVPLAHPERAEIVSSPRIFQDLVAPPSHGPAPGDIRAIEEAEAEGKFVASFSGQQFVLPDGFANQLLAQTVAARGGEGPPTAADSAELRENLDDIIASRFGGGDTDESEDDGPRPGPTQCHDITLYPEIGLAGGACEGYGLLLDITDPVNPKRIDAVADSNFAYWHSATFSNDGESILFTDEWGGGGGPKCRYDEQTPLENCVAHNGSMIPIPGRDVMVQAWYQGGISVFDFTDPANPVEIAFFDRGPVDPDQMQMAGSWSVYWYNGLIVSSEIARGLDILELTPSRYLTANEIEAAKTVRFDHLNAQGQQMFKWPASFALARARVDQLERAGELDTGRASRTRSALDELEGVPASERKDALMNMAVHLDELAGSAANPARIHELADTVRTLAGM
ncbi:MAG: hypothetical protein P8049_08400 [Gemmatimonadota bacterium]